MVDDGTNANNDTLLGGSGDDVFRFTGTDGLDDGDSINGYGGTDTIDVRNSAATNVVIDFADVYHYHYERDPSAGQCKPKGARPPPSASSRMGG